MSDDLIARIRARASNPNTLYDMAEGMSPPPQMWPVATPEAITEAEKLIGYELPPLYKRILAEVANGGVGPGYGLVGVFGGSFAATGCTLQILYLNMFTSESEFAAVGWRKGLIPILTWGCGIYSVADLTKPGHPVYMVGSGEHVANDQGAAPAPASLDSLMKLERNTFDEFMGAWADGVKLWDELM